MTTPDTTTPRFEQRHEDQIWDEAATHMGWKFIPALGVWKHAESLDSAEDAEGACDLFGVETIDDAIAIVAGNL